SFASPEHSRPECRLACLFDPGSLPPWMGAWGRLFWTHRLPAWTQPRPLPDGPHLRRVHRPFSIRSNLVAALSISLFGRARNWRGMGGGCFALIRDMAEVLAGVDCSDPPKRSQCGCPAGCARELVDDANRLKTTAISFPGRNHSRAPGLVDSSGSSRTGGMAQSEGSDNAATARRSLPRRGGQNNFAGDCRLRPLIDCALGVYVLASNPAQ